MLPEKRKRRKLFVLAAERSQRRVLLGHEVADDNAHRAAGQGLAGHAVVEGGDADALAGGQRAQDDSTKALRASNFLGDNARGRILS